MTFNGGRAAVLIAVLLQAAGKVAYGTWLSIVPTALFVLVSFSLTAVLFATAAQRTRGERAIALLVLLNTSTAVTFLAFFHALKLIEPAIVGAVEISVGPPLALLASYLLYGTRPERVQVIVGAGILAGCATLAVSAYLGSGVPTGDSRAAEGMLASLAAGVGAVIITMSSRTLMDRGWSRGAVLAHRFYMIIPVALIFTLDADIDPIVQTLPVVATILAVATLGVVIPLYLLQIGIEKSNAYTVLSTMAALPVFTFALETLSPAYRLSWLTATGVAIITAALLFAAHRARHSPLARTR